MRASFSLAALAVVLAMSPGTPAEAQSFFESLFGGFQSKPKDPLPPALPSYRTPIRTPMSRAEPSGQGTAHRSTAHVRTVCVRLCDGYYFPISSRTPADRITADSSRCKSSCDSDARLYYGSASSDDPAAMTDVTGRRYDSLDTAFAYRKKLIPGCACKPVPWSSAERQRHMTYAAEVTAANAREGEKAASDQDGDGLPASPRSSESQIAENGNGVDVPAAAVASASDTGREQSPAREMSATSPRKRTGDRTRLVTSDVDGQRPKRSREPRPVTAHVTSATNTGTGGFLNFGKSKYVWPGDPR